MGVRSRGEGARSSLFQATPNGFDGDSFLDDLQFDEDLSAFSPDSSSLLRSPNPAMVSARPPRWTDEEVRKKIPQPDYVYVCTMLNRVRNLYDCDCSCVVRGGVV